MHRVFPTYPIGVTRLMCDLEAAACMLICCLTNLHRQTYSTYILVYPYESPILQSYRVANCLTVICMVHASVAEVGLTFLILSLTCQLKTSSFRERSSHNY